MLVANEQELIESQPNLESPNSTGTPISISTAFPTSTPAPTLIPTLGYKPQAWTIYSHADIGLSPPVSNQPYLGIYDIEEDQSGDMWFASTYGLIRFDGNEWELENEDYSQPYVRSAYIQISSSDEIWFTLSDGVYSLREEVVQKRMNYSGFGVDMYDVTGFSLSPSGQVWIALRDSIWVLDGNDWITPESKNELTFSYVSDLVNDQNGILFAWGDIERNAPGETASGGPVSSGLCSYGGSQWICFDQKEQYGIPAEDETIISGYPLITDSQNHTWFYMWRKGLFEYVDGKFIRHAPHDIDLYHPITMAFDQQGVLWLGAWGEGVQLLKFMPGSDRFQSIDDSFTLFIEEEGNEGFPISRNELEGIIPFEHVSALYVDSKNDLWIATELGVYVFDIDMD